MGHAACIFASPSSVYVTLKAAPLAHPAIATSRFWPFLMRVSTFSKTCPLKQGTLQNHRRWMAKDARRLVQEICVKTSSLQATFFMGVENKTCWLLPWGQVLFIRKS